MREIKFRGKTRVINYYNRRLAMLKVRFDVEFDRNGDIVAIRRYCNIPRPCENCKFKEWCDRVENKVEEVKNERG